MCLYNSRIGYDTSLCPILAVTYTTLDVNVEKRGEMKVDVWVRFLLRAGIICDPTRARNDLFLPLTNQNPYNCPFPLGRGPFLPPLCNGPASTGWTRDDTNEADLIQSAHSFFFFFFLEKLKFPQFQNSSVDFISHINNILN